MRVGVFGVIEQIERAARAFCQAPAVGEAGALFGERGEFAAFQGERFELLHLVLEELEPIVPLAGGRLESDERSRALEPQAMQPRHFRSLRFGACVAIEQFTLRRRAHQRLKLVLTVDLGEPLADLAQHLHRYGLAIEVGARFALAGDHAPHQQLVTDLDALFFEQRAQPCARLPEIEGSRHFSARRIVTNHLAACTGADCELQCIDEDGLASTRFAREYAEPSAKLELDGIDDGEITDVQVREHARWAQCCTSKLRRPQLSLLRSSR